VFAPILKYRSGEEIRKGDHLRFHGNPAEIKLVACDPGDPDPEIAWHMKEFGGGVLILDPLVSGRTFIPKDSLDGYEDLEFVSRGSGSWNKIAVSPAISFFGMWQNFLLIRFQRIFFIELRNPNVHHRP
jgi:hypothetical protein